MVLRPCLYTTTAGCVPSRTNCHYLRCAANRQNCPGCCYDECQHSIRLRKKIEFIPTIDFAPANVRPTDRPDPTEGVAAADVVAADIAVAAADGVAAADVVADSVVVAASDVVAAADGFDCVDGEAPADGVTQPGQSTPKQNIDNASAYVSPSDIIPFPKAAPRKTIRGGGGRKKGSTSILTDTPVRKRIAAATELRKAVEERKQHKLTVKAQKLAEKHVTQPNRSLLSHGAI